MEDPVHTTQSNADQENRDKLEAWSNGDTERKLYS